MSPEQIGPYVILEKLGAGGMGTVYLGRHRDTGQMAAVKMLPASHAREEGFVERFSREIEAMQKLNNPHIVRPYESGADHDTYYCAMEYVAGETIMSLLKREKRVAWDRAVDFTIQICQALKAAHDAGIIHRDLKPSNLLLTPEGMIKLTDFGVAQVFAADRLTVTGGIIGTAEYMSPEQAAGKRVTRQSDLYSLGAVLYCLVTGRPPFHGTAAVDVIQKHRFGIFDRPRLIVPELPVWLEEIICQLLEKEPEKRFPDATVLMRRLQTMMQRHQNPITSDVTLEGEATSDPDAATIASSPDGDTRPGRTGPGPATFMREALRAELDERPSPLAELFNNTWVLVCVLALVIGGAVWMTTRSPGTPSASEPEELSDGDTRLQKLQLSLKARKDLVPADDARRQLFRAQSALERGDRAEARRIASGLATLLAGDTDRERERELAEQLLGRLGDPPGDDRYGAVVAALERAEREAKAGRRQPARALWESVVDLYGTDPDARKYVDIAKQALESR